VSASDWLLAASLVFNGILAVIHVAIGVPHWGDATTDWTRIFRGSYFAIAFAWLEVVALMLALLAVGNPLGIWLGVIALLAFSGQVAMMWTSDPIAAKLMLIHVAVCAVWIAARLGGH
jgi:hypothetical protein